MLLFWSVSVAHAATLVVNPAGGVGKFTKIQDAINAAGAGDVVSVEGGTYNEAIDFLGKAIEVRGVSVDTVIIDRKGTSVDAVKIGASAGAVLATVTIRNGTQRGLKIDQATARIEGVKFDNLGLATSSTFHGGGAWVLGGSATFVDCTFFSNAGWFGGDLYVTDGGVVDLVGGISTFATAEFGGSVYVADGALSLDSVTIDDAFADISGGALYLVGDPLTSVDAAFHRDNTGGGSSDYGGAIFLGAGSTWDDVGSIFVDNTAYNGGAVHAKSATVTLDGTIFNDNGYSAGYYGGAIHADSSALDFTSAVFELNAVQDLGAAVHGTNTTLVDTDGVWTGNWYSSAVALYGDSPATFDGSTFTANDTGPQENGGAIYTTSSLTLTDCTFTGNTADWNGGAVYQFNSVEPVVIDNSVFDGNSISTWDGGALHIWGPLTVRDSTFLDNFAPTLGGAIFERDDAVIERSSFEGNSNEGINVSGNLTVRDSSFVGHSGGAAINFLGFGLHDLLLERSSFVGNLSPYGAAVVAAAPADLTVRHSTFIDNGNAGTLVSQEGGALNIQFAGKVAVVGNVFCANHAYAGGAILVESSLALAQGDDEYTNNIFQANTAVNKGGAFVGVASKYLGLVNNTFVDNSSVFGGIANLDLATDGMVKNNVLVHTVAGDGAYGATVADFTYNLWFDNVTKDNAGGLTLSEARGVGTLLLDPVFAGWTDNGLCDDLLTPGVGSPLVDAGDPALLDVDGSASDIGYSGGLLSPLRDDDVDGVVAFSDCDDLDPTVYPGAAEIWYDGIDQDCAGGDDFDQDGDAFPLDDDCDDTAAAVNRAALDVWYDGVDADCSGGSDYDQDGDGQDIVPVGTDCDDLWALVFAGAADTWYDGIDSNCDGANDFDQDADGSELALDCDDLEPTVFPGAVEVWYDGIDGDCDGGDDFDQDSDGYVLLGGGGDDCDDVDATVHPGAVESWYDGIDGDCDGASDYDQDRDGDDRDGDGGGDCDDLDAGRSSVRAEVWYDGVDADCDGADDFDQDRDGAQLGPDCADTDAAIRPGAADPFYDGVDSNCDGANDFDQDADGDSRVGNGGGDCADLDAAISSHAAEVWYDGVDGDCDGANDFDQDGDGDPSAVHGVGADCDDEAAAVNSMAAEIWYDGTDGDCDGADDFDQDGDGVLLGVDCVDTAASIYPGAADAFYDGIDSDCDGANDFDQDGDGDDRDLDGGGDCDDEDAAINSLATEVWYDGVDSDCDGASDFDQDRDGDVRDLDGGGDCDDEDAAISSLANEVWYDGIDGDCDGADDYDQDGDGDALLGSGGGDCADLDPDVNSLAAEVWYDGIDQDCSGGSDDDQDGDGVSVELDCDDADSTVFPGAPESADGLDSDCDGHDVPPDGPPGDTGEPSGAPGCGGCAQTGPAGGATWWAWVLGLGGLVRARRGHRAHAGA